MACIVIHGSAVGIHIDFDRADTNGGWGRGRLGLSAAQHGANPGHHFGRVEGLDHIVIGAQAQGQQLVHIVGQGRHHDDRNFAVIANHAQYVYAIHLGQMDVQQNKVGAQLSEVLQSFFAILCHADAQAIALQIGAEHAGNTRLILNDEHHGGGSRLNKGIHGFLRSKVMHERLSETCYLHIMCFGAAINDCR